MKQAKTTYELLEQIRVANGGILRPRNVVDEAEPKDHPLHPQFEWDNRKAADQYRVWQARHLILTTVTVLDDDPKQCPIRAYVSLAEDRGNPDGGYRPIVDVLRDPVRSGDLLQEALAALVEWQNKYRKLKALAPVFQAIKKVTKRSA